MTMMDELRETIEEVYPEYSPEKRKATIKLIIGGLIFLFGPIWGLLFMGIGLAAIFLVWGLFIGAGVLLYTGYKTAKIEEEKGRVAWLSSSLKKLLRLVNKLDYQTSIYGRDYGRLLVVVERDFKLGRMTRGGKSRILKALQESVFRKNKRISGSDYVELEKTLSQTGTITVDEKEIKLFSEAQIERILKNYEKLRERIRDRAIGGAR